MDLSSLTKMKYISTTMIPPIRNLVGVLKSRWKEGSLEHEALTGPANNPGPNSYNVTSFILTQTSFLARSDKIELKTELQLWIAVENWSRAFHLFAFILCFFFWKSSRSKRSRMETRGHGMSTNTCENLVLHRQSLLFLSCKSPDLYAAPQTVISCWLACVSSWCLMRPFYWVETFHHNTGVRNGV